MKHQTLDKLQVIAKVDQDYPSQALSRSERLERWAQLLERNPEKRLTTLRETEYQPEVVRARLREDGSALLEIPVNAGLVGLALTVAIAPVLLAIGAIAAVVSQVTLVVERRADAAGSVDAPTTTPTAGTAGGSADQDPAASI